MIKETRENLNLLFYDFNNSTKKWGASDDIGKWDSLNNN